MFRRRSTDDEALAEAYRRLDGVSTASAPAQSPVAASSLAEAARVDAVLRGLLQPVAAPDTLAGRVAGEIGRARVARWRQGSVAARRPVWAMALAGAVVVVLVVGAAMATMPGGGTIGERARGVGEWVRAVLGVGVRGEAGDDEAYYWVPGMGILPLRPDAVVATGPVTVTDGYPTPIVIEGMVADSRGTMLVVRGKGAWPEDERSPAMPTIYRGESRGSKTTIRACNASNGSFVSDVIRPQECTFGPLLLTERTHGVAHFGMPRSARGQIEFFDADRPYYTDARDGYDFDDRDYVRFLQSLRPVDVPLVSVASGKLKRAHRLGDGQTHGGIRLRAWGVEPGAGQLAVRVEPVDVAPSDDVRFVSADSDARTYVMWPDIDFVLSAFGLKIGPLPATRPVAMWEHAPWQSDDGLPRGRAFPRWTAATAASAHGSYHPPQFPVTVVFHRPDGIEGTNGSLIVGPLLLAVDDVTRVDRPRLSGPHSATVRVDTVAATIAYTENFGMMAHSGLAPERYPVTRTLHFAERTLLIGVAVEIDPGELQPVDANSARVIRRPRAMITLHWSDDGSDGRQLIDMAIGHAQRRSLWHGLRRACAGFNPKKFTYVGGYGRPQTGTAPSMWRIVGDTSSEILPSVTLCLSRPIFQIPGPWTFPIDQP